MALASLPRLIEDSWMTKLRVHSTDNWVIIVIYPTGNPYINYYYRTVTRDCPNLISRCWMLLFYIFLPFTPSINIMCKYNWLQYLYIDIYTFICTNMLTFILNLSLFTAFKYTRIHDTIVGDLEIDYPYISL